MKTAQDVLEYLRLQYREYSSRLGDDDEESAAMAEGGAVALGSALFEIQRAALSAPDPLPEAVEIIERLLSHEKSWKQDQEMRVQAREFVARHKGGGM